MKDEDENGEQSAGGSEKEKEGRARRESSGNWRRYGSRCNENIVQRILKSRVLGTTKRALVRRKCFLLSSPCTRADAGVAAIPAGTLSRGQLRGRCKSCAR